jgi:hypothetical protein
MCCVCDMVTRRHHGRLGRTAYLEADRANYLEDKPMTEGVLPINKCLMIARRKMMDAAWERQDARPKCRRAVNEFEAQAREALEMAQAQGWRGDIEATIREWREL